MMEVLSEVHNAPDQCITFSFHRMESPLHRGQPLAGVCYDSFHPSVPLREDGTDSFR
jgi:hypothetical protein